MGKVKNALVILCSLLLAAAGSLLPMAAARIQDNATTNVVEYENIQALQLKLEEEVLSMTYPEKMSLIMHGIGLEITDENTRIKESELLDVVNAALAPYTELFYGITLDNDYAYYYPVTVYDERDPSRNCCYWYVTLSLDSSMKDEFAIILDDETGKVLALEMKDPEMYIEEAYLPELQSALAGVYLLELNLMPVAEWAMEKKEPYDTPTAAHGYQFVDVIYGLINVEIGVHTNGFYIWLL